MQSDPIGLEGGINTYGYANQNPLINIDQYGLNWFRVLPRNVQNTIRNLPEAVQNKRRNTPQVPKSRSNRHKNKSADDVPTWARGQRPTNGEDGEGFAPHLCDDKYGPGNYETGPKSPYNQIKKWGAFIESSGDFRKLHEKLLFDSKIFADENIATQKWANSEISKLQTLFATGLKLFFDNMFFMIE